MKILFLVPYPSGKSPSQRFRFEQYLQILSESGHYCRVSSLYSSQYGIFFLESGKYFASLWMLLTGFARRCSILFSVPKYDRIFVHREAFPLGPPVFEFIIARILAKKIIYDFDDAIWLSDRPGEPFLFRTLKSRSKVKKICRLSHVVSCGNEYLAQYARQYNNAVTVNPTTIDTEGLHSPDRYPLSTASRRVTIGWTGSRSTLKYLKLVEPAVSRLLAEFDHLSFVVIADQRPELSIDRLIFVPWKLSREIEDLFTIDIGIMPMNDDEWTRGKCGFKILQYMALGIAAVASPVGTNREIIQDGKNGFLCTTDDEWYSALKTLVLNESLRRDFGMLGRELVVKSYSVHSNTATFLSLFA